MKKSSIILGLIFLVSLSLFTKCSTDSPDAKSETTATVNKSKEEIHAERVKRGAYLVDVIGCDDCHSPKIFSGAEMEIDFSRRLSGYPADQPIGQLKDPEVLKTFFVVDHGFTSAIGPWGTSFAANLTPDETGTGNWTEAQFIKAIREGKLKGMDNTRPLLPPMPWFIYKKMTDEDLKSIFAFLQTLPPIKNVVPAPIPPPAS